MTLPTKTRPTARPGRSPLGRRGLLLGAVQGLLLLSLAGTLVLQRWQRPRAWGVVTPLDPQLPIRGRYLELQLAVPAPDLAAQGTMPIRLVALGGRLLARAAQQPGDSDVLLARVEPGPRAWRRCCWNPWPSFCPRLPPIPAKGQDRPLYGWKSPCRNGVHPGRSGWDANAMAPWCRCLRRSVVGKRR